jgi:hypothetical protein
MLGVTGQEVYDAILSAVVALILAGAGALIRWLHHLAQRVDDFGRPPAAPAPSDGD